MKQSPLNQIKKKIRIIECESIELSEKDIITLKKRADFDWMLKENNYVLKSQDSYYIIGETVAWVWNGIH